VARLVPTPLLSIETSCDETAAAVMDDGFRLLSNIVHSQIDDHAPFGGVLPEIASRRHLEMIGPVVRRALEEADIAPRAVAVTAGPGLIGSLLVGIAFAESFAIGRGLPAFGVHHLAGHLAAVRIERPDWKPPYLALIVSGGHTEILFVRSAGEPRQRVARTLDDAAGEAFDKAARLLGLGYPGGPAIAGAAEDAGSERMRLAGSLMRGAEDFSFSGLKTALRNAVIKCQPIDVATTAILAASFQDEIVRNLVEKTEKALSMTRAPRLVVSGGVAANRRLREAISAMAERMGVEIALPAPAFCTDNAAMIAAAALASSSPRPLSTMTPSASLAAWD
jgi:N6-L-threonylcarbamoyladenine synthase